MRKFRIDRSTIHGKGVIASSPISEGEAIGVAVTVHNGIPTITSDLGVFVNHCRRDNSRLIKMGGNYDLVAIRDIEIGEEITSDYNLAPWFISRPGAHFT